MYYITQFDISYNRLNKEEQQNLIKHILEKYPVLSYANEGIYSGPPGEKMIMDGVYSGPPGVATLRKSSTDICPGCKRPL